MQRWNNECSRYKTKVSNILRCEKKKIAMQNLEFYIKKTILTTVLMGEIFSNKNFLLVESLQENPRYSRVALYYCINLNWKRSFIYDRTVLLRLSSNHHHLHHIRRHQPIRTRAENVETAPSAGKRVT